MEQAAVAELQVLLEGASGEQIALLQGLPERSYDTIDEVGEELAPVQPEREREVPHPPGEESGLPPGGDAYTQPHPERGQVRDLDAVSGG